jgi:hypothetical protein
MLIFTNLQKHFPVLPISHDQVLLVSNALLGRSSVVWKRAEAADTYLRVWQAFAEKRTPTPSFYNLQENVVLIAAKLAIFPPFQPGWRKTLRRIHEVEPKWMLAFVRKFPEMVSTKIHARFIRQNRK